MIDEMGYTIVYNVQDLPAIEWGTVGLSAVLVFCFLTVLAALRRYLTIWRRDGEHWGRGMFLGIGAAGSIIIVLATGVDAFLQYSDVSRLQDRVSSGRYELVEGQVMDFVPGDREGHQYEMFTVASNGRRYQYRYRSSTIVPGFHQSAGPVHPGAYVRIADVDGYIARLEIRRE